MTFGKCTPRKILTKKLGMPGWEIYRDSTYGMYALHEELGLDIDLGRWNIPLNSPNLENILQDIRRELTICKFQELTEVEDKVERREANPSRGLTIKKVNAKEINSHVY